MKTSLFDFGSSSPHGVLEVAVEDHVHRVVHKLLGGVRDVEHALHPVEVGALLLEDARRSTPARSSVEVDLACAAR